MNKLFIDDLVERLEFEIDTVTVNTQDEVRKAIVETKEYDRFPMISYEHTRDSIFEVEISESKFLNDLSHNGTWIMGTNQDDLIFMLNLKSNGNVLEIDAFEVRDELRGQGLGANILSVVESVAEQYYSSIIVSPFDTTAINFWERMEYEEDKNGCYWTKQL